MKTFTRSREGVIDHLQRRKAIIAFASKTVDKKLEEAKKESRPDEVNKYSYLQIKARTIWKSINEAIDEAFEQMEKPGRYIVRPYVARIANTEEDNAFLESREQKKLKKEWVLRDIGGLRQLLYIASENRDWKAYLKDLRVWQTEAREMKEYAEQSIPDDEFAVTGYLIKAA